MCRITVLNCWTNYLVTDQICRMEDKYKSMSVPELAGEDSFIRWVTKGENDQRWCHWLDQDPERTKIISEAKQIVQALSVLPSTEIDPHDKSALWTRIHHSIHHRSS